MTIKLSPHKVSRILRGYFNGLPQITIAKEVAVDQSSVSICASVFKRLAARVGLLAAGKEFGVNNEVDTLRSLSVELYNAGLTVVDALQGVAIIKTFHRMGVEPEQHALLVKVCKEIDDANFVESAIKLADIECTTGMGYDDTIKRFEEVTTQLPPLEDRLQDRETKLESIESTIKERRQELDNCDTTLAQSREASNKTIRERELALSKRMKQFDIEENDINDTAKLKSYFAKQDLDIPTLVKLAKEFIVATKSKINTVKLQKALQMFGSLDKVIGSIRGYERELNTTVQALEADIKVKKEDKAKRQEELAKLTEAVTILNNKLNQIFYDIKRYGDQYRSFECIITCLKDSPLKDDVFEELYKEFFVLSKMDWKPYYKPDQLKRVLISKAIGQYMNSYQCTCGIKFNTNKPPKSKVRGFLCPDCGFSFSVVANDSLLEAMLGSTESS